MTKIKVLNLYAGIGGIIYIADNAGQQTPYEYCMSHCPMNNMKFTNMECPKYCENLLKYENNQANNEPRRY